MAIMKSSIAISVVLTGLLSWSSLAMAQNTRTSSSHHQGDPLSSDPQDPGNVLREVEQFDAEREALFPVSPLGGFRDRTNRAKQIIYEATGIKMGLVLQNVGQGLSEVLPGKADIGTATDLDFVAKRELIHKGKPNHGGVYWQLQGRWDYGTTGPQTLGFDSLASAGGTANMWSAYTPSTFLTRNLYWQQGSQEAGWAYRVGKITPDQTLMTSANISPVTTFLPNVGTCLCSMGIPDSGLGGVGGWFPNDRIRVLGLVSDSNANRQNFGDIGADDYYTAGEFGIKIAPMTQNAGYSKVALWHNDGTKNGLPINMSTGREGWGFSVLLEQELTSDGRAVGIFRYGKSYNNPAIFKQQAGLSLVLKDPGDPIRLKNDLVGVAFNWVESPVTNSRDEYNFEVFYRFPIFPAVDTTLSYQSIFDPALTTKIDHASAFSLRVRTTY
jgi:porin